MNFKELLLTLWSGVVIIFIITGICHSLHNNNTNQTVKHANCIVKQKKSIQTTPHSASMQSSKEQIQIPSSAMIVKKLPLQNKASTAISLKPTKKTLIKQNEAATIIAITKSKFQKNNSMKEKIKPRIITIENNISEAMLSFTYLGKKHQPIFSIFVNNKPIEKGASKEIRITDNKVTVSYSYMFAGGIYKGTRSVSLNLALQSSKFSLTFSWKDRPRIKLNQINFL